MCVQLSSQLETSGKDQDPFLLCHLSNVSAKFLSTLPVSYLPS